MKYEYDFPMAGVTATAVIYNPRTSEVLLGKRKPDSGAFPNRWCLPGGYLNVGTERLVNAIRRETYEETNLDISEDRWSLFYTDDAPGSDPRYDQVINLCYDTQINPEEYGIEVAGDDVVELKWVDLGDARFNYDLAFAHNEILEEYHQKINVRKH